jgi:hypothetical protein
MTGELTGEPGISDLLGQSGQRLTLAVRQLDVVVAHGDLLEFTAALVGSYPDQAPSTLHTSAAEGGGCSQR